jgi:hypothetical protein
MRRSTSVSLALSAVFMLSLPLIGGCREEGPLEKTGRKVEEKWDEITHPNEGPLEKAGRKMDEAIEEAGEKLKKKDD